MKPKKRKKLTGTRIIRGRIYSEFGKSCHQCHQKTLDFGVTCKNFKTETKQCTIHYCHSCLRNRYREKAKDIAKLLDCKWPKCWKICNCSLCMRRRGCFPTGRLVRVTKAIGYSTVSKMLQLENSQEVPLALPSIGKEDGVYKLSEGTEKSRKKRSKKNHYSKNVAMDISGSSKEVNTSKNFVVYQGEKYSNGASGPTMQDTSFSPNEKEMQQRMFKVSENGDVIIRTIDGYNSGTDEISREKYHNSDEVTSSDEMSCREDDVDQLEATESKMQMANSDDAPAMDIKNKMKTMQLKPMITVIWMLEFRCLEA